MTCIAVQCPHCQSEQIVQRGKTARGTQRYLCQNILCTAGSLLLDYRNRGYVPEVKRTIIDMSLNTSGVRDTARVLRITGAVLAYVFGRCQDEVFLQLQGLLEPFGITPYSTDPWGAYTRHLEPEMHSPGKRNMQKIARKHLTLRTRIKRLTHKTIGFSKSVQMHDIVIGLFVDRYAFGRAV